MKEKERPQKMAARKKISRKNQKKLYFPFNNTDLGGKVIRSFAGI